MAVEEILPDGRVYTSYQERDSGREVRAVGQNPDGTRWERETFYDEKGEMLYWTWTADDGNHQEQWYENGTCVKFIYSNPEAGEYQEQVCDEYGRIKYRKNQEPDSVVEMIYDEDGYLIYYWFKGVNSEGVSWEIECITDETGKLEKVIENGEEIDNPEYLAEYAAKNGFRFQK